MRRTQQSIGTVTVAILAGGAGTRLGGRDKGLVELAGEPLIAHVLRAVPRDAAVLIVANRHLDDYAKFGRVVRDLDAGTRGPLAGIATALAAAETAFVATLPVDCPQPPAHWVERLGTALHGDRAPRVAVAHDGSRRQPLFALYHRSLADCARTALERDVPVWRWQDEAGVVEADFFDDAASFANLNTPDDFDHWTQRHAHERR